MISKTTTTVASKPLKTYMYRDGINLDPKCSKILDLKSANLCQFFTTKYLPKRPPSARKYSAFLCLLQFMFMFTSYVYVSQFSLFFHLMLLYRRKLSGDFRCNSLLIGFLNRSLDFVPVVCPYLSNIVPNFPLQPSPPGSAPRGKPPQGQPPRPESDFFLDPRRRRKKQSLNLP